MFRACLAGGILTLYTCLTASAGASVLYSSANETGDRLFTINQLTGAATPIAPTGLSQLRDLASDTRPGSFRLWGIDGGTRQLYRIDPASATPTLVGTFEGTLDIRNVAFDITTGRMFGVTQGPAPIQLYEIDPHTAATTLRGTLPGNPFFGALAFNLTGTLYSVDETNGRVYTINTETAATTEVSQSGLLGIADIAFRPEDGVMFATAISVGVPFPGGSNNIYTIDPATGQSTLIGPYGQGVVNMAGLAFGEVPEPGTALVLTCGLLALSLGRYHGRGVCHDSDH